MRPAGMTLALAAGLNGCAMVGTAYDHSVCDLVSEAGASQALIVAAAEAAADE